MSTITNFTASDGWYLGEDKVLVWNVVDADGVGVALTDLGIQFTLSATEGGAALPEFPVIADHTDDANGICATVIPSEATADLDAGQYWYTLWIIDSSTRTELSGGTVDLLAPQTERPF